MSSETAAWAVPDVAELPDELLLEVLPVMDVPVVVGAVAAAGQADGEGEGGDGEGGAEAVHGVFLR